MTRPIDPAAGSAAALVGRWLVPALLALAAASTDAAAQVALEGELHVIRLDGRPALLARLPVRNGTAVVWRVDVGRVFAQVPDATAIVLGEMLPAHASPRTFILNPGESQIVAVTIDPPAAAPSRYRLEITVSDGQPIQSGQAGGVRTVLTMATRYLVKLNRPTR